MPATRTERTAAAAVCETHGTQHLAERLDTLRDELGEINVGSPRKEAFKNGWENPVNKAGVL